MPSALFEGGGVCRSFSRKRNNLQSIFPLQMVLILFRARSASCCCWIYSNQHYLLHYSDLISSIYFFFIFLFYCRFCNYLLMCNLFPMLIMVLVNVHLLGPHIIYMMGLKRLSRREWMYHEKLISWTSIL